MFGGPTPGPTLDDSSVTGSALSGAPGITLAGAGIFSVGSPLTITITDSLVARNTPDPCAGASC